MAHETAVTTRERNQAILSYLETPGLEKKAVDSINNFTRTTMREDGFYRKIIPPVTITNDELDRVVETDKPVKIIDKEPGSPAAISLPFANLPINIYIKAPRYRVLFERIMTHRFTKDVDELRTYVMDVRQVISDNAIKDMLAEEDGKFIAAVNTAMGARDSNHALAGVPLYKGISGSMGRNEVVEMLTILNKTPWRLEPHTCLTNFVSWKMFMKWGREEMGGDLSEKIIKEGMMEETFLGRKWVVTIKRDLVPDDTVFMFPDPKFIGKNFMLEDTTLYLKREAFMLEWFAYQSGGGAIGHPGLARADFI